MNKRIIIFADSSETIQEEIKFILEDYFKKNFEEYYHKGIDIQTFYNINKSINAGKKIGLGGEVLVMFDKRKEIRRRDLYHESLKALLDLSKNICSDEEIPTITYQGEIERQMKYEFLLKIDNIKDEIRNRLNKLENEVNLSY